MKTILFQGDSVTDAQRLRNDPDHMGSGYALMAAARLGCESVGEYICINRGVGGNKSTDVYARMKEDIIDLSPDYMSILVGVNDVWHQIDYNCGETAETYETVMEKLITETRAALPKCKIMLMEPYVLKEYETVSTVEKPDKWETFKREVTLRAELTKKLCDKYNLKFIPLQQILDEAANKSRVNLWSLDGVHPTPAGHLLIAEAWVKAFREIEE